MLLHFNLDLKINRQNKNNRIFTSLEFLPYQNCFILFLLVCFAWFVSLFEIVWVDAPDPSVCGFQFGGRCCLNGRFDQQYQWRNFASGEKKKEANEQLWAQSQYNRQPFYQGLLMNFIKGKILRPTTVS